MGIIRIKQACNEGFLSWRKRLSSKGAEYRNFFAFLEELSMMHSDVVEAELWHEKEIAKERFYALNNTVKRYPTTSEMYSFRDGLNIHCEFHSFPEPVMFVWFEDTGQKRIIPAKSQRWAMTAADGVSVPGASEHQEYAVLDGGVLRTWCSGSDIYFQLQGQDYIYTPAEHFAYGKLYELLSRSYLSDGFDVLVFDYEVLKQSGVNIPDEYFVDYTPLMTFGFTAMSLDDLWTSGSAGGDVIYPWFKNWFIPWYIKSGFQCL